MKVQILGINYAPELISTAVYTTDLAESLVAQGHMVDVVTAQPYFPAWKVMEGWQRLRYRRERRTGVPVLHCPLYVPKEPNARRRMLHYLSFTLAALIPMIWRGIRHRPEITFVAAPSLVSALAGWVCARLAGGRLWIHVQDFEVEAAFATGAIGAQSRFGRWALAFERWMLRRADMVSTISPAMVKKLGQKGVPKQRRCELRNWADLDHVGPVKGENPLRDELGVQTRHVVLYSGNIAMKQGIELIPEAAGLLADRTDLTFVICGQGPMLGPLQEMARGLPNILFLPLQPKEALSDLLGLADLHLLPQIDSVSDLLLPSKLTNMLASGRPVVATVAPDTALAEEVQGVGAITPPGDAAAFAAAITELLDDPPRRAALGEAARARAEDRWNKPAIIARFMDRAEALIARKTA